MARYEHMLFVCTNLREASDPRGSCQARGALKLLDRLKELTHAHQLKGKVRATSSGCLDCCARGITVAVFSAGAPAAQTWYTRVTPEDADELFQTHVLSGRRVERLAEPT